MIDGMKSLGATLLLATLAVLHTGSAASADNAVWRVSKSSGDVWVVTSGVQQAALTDETILNPGDSIRTGRNGRVLLVRGQEKILISPNSAIAVPTDKNQGKATTIIQQAGSILLEVEKRSDQHFEVETPYLAAVVRGTQFRVSVGQDESYVNVVKGKVEVADFRSGQYAAVLPGQMAKVWAKGIAGLSLSGSGKLSPVLYGNPRTPSVTPIHVPKEGLSAPERAASGQHIRIAAPRGDANSFSTWPETKGANDKPWNTNFISKLLGNANNPRAMSDTDYLVMAIPVAFGGFIAFAVAAKRRRRQQK